MHTHATVIRLGDTDAAGCLYFANQFRLAHEAYEAWLTSIGMPLGNLLAAGRIGLPIVHASADFRTPLRVGDAIEINIRPARIGRTSFTLVYRITHNGETAGHVTTIHVAVSGKRAKPRALPVALRKHLGSAPKAL